MDQVVDVNSLHKKYGDLVAVNDISFSVNQGEIFGIVGPNGAGKTTMVECLEGLRSYDKGRVSVLGLDPKKDGMKLRHLVGIQLQESRLPDRIRVWEALDLFSSFYRKSLPWKPLLDQLGLQEKSRAYFDNLSGGQKQRLSIAMALINDPEIVFFDELTTGLDPQARRAIWQLVEGVRDQGKTVVLVTHFMEEAERLCDRLAIIDQGNVIALDSPKNLVKKLNHSREIHFATSLPLAGHELLEIDGISHFNELKPQTYQVWANNLKAVADLINWLAARNIELTDFHLVQPNLEDVFINLTGKQIRD